MVNGGTDGSGTNYKKNINKYNTVLNDQNNIGCNFEYLNENQRIRREFRKRYMNPISVIKWHFWWMLRKRGIISITRIKR